MSEDPNDRPLVSGHPDLARRYHETFERSVSSRTEEDERILRVMGYLHRLVGRDRIKKVLVLGCGPRPQPIACLRSEGYEVCGIEPIKTFVESANTFLGASLVTEGAAERISLPDASQDLVLFEAVLEHVESPEDSLKEIFRVTSPGGLAVVSTTNRHRFRFTGENGEYRVPFYNWFPALVKESYVFQHLHVRPHLANYSLRPAVHWFTYSELCRLGRYAGFAQFYSLIDLVRPGDPSVQRSWVRRMAYKLIQKSPWVRALALTQVGDFVIMYKRP